MEFYGNGISKAIKNILIRKRERVNNAKNSRKGIKSALIVQGGGMRGIFSAGCLIALEKLGFNTAFDSIYASSSGALNASYFLANQSPFGGSIYYENINNSKFINMLRLKKIMDIDYLFDEVISCIKPLNINKVINSKTPLYFFVSDAYAGTTSRFDSKSKNLFYLLKASCAIPVLYNRPVFVNEKNYFDGGIYKAIPIEEAIKDGCTDILVLLTHSIKFRKSTSFFEKFLVKKALSKFSAKMFDIYLRGIENYNYEFDVSIGKIKIKEKVNIATIVPNDALKLSRLTKNEKLLKDAAIDGAGRIFTLFNEKYDISHILDYKNFNFIKQN